MLKLQDILKCLGGTSWKYPTIDSKFVPYGADTTRVKYRRVGQAVYLQGEIKPAASVKLDGNLRKLFTLPKGYRPAYVGVWLCQGSGTSFWSMKVEPDGSVYVCRARDVGNANGAYTTIPTTYWMPFYVSFVTEETYPEPFN